MKDWLLATLATLTIFSSFFAFVAIKEAYELRSAVMRLSQRWEVTTEKPYVNSRSRDFRAGYHAAIMDKRNIKIFEKYYNCKRDYIIFDYFERQK
jgi:hypothetical protein